MSHRVGHSLERISFCGNERLGVLWNRRKWFTLQTISIDLTPLKALFCVVCDTLMLHLSSHWIKSTFIMGRDLGFWVFLFVSLFPLLFLSLNISSTFTICQALFEALRIQYKSNQTVHSKDSCLTTNILFSPSFFSKRTHEF